MSIISMLIEMILINDISGKSNKNSKIPPLQSCIDENDNATDRDR